MVSSERMSDLSARSRRHETAEFRLIFALGFVIFLVAALIARLVPESMRPRSLSAKGSRSIFHQAKTAASNCVPFAFMG